MINKARLGLHIHRVQEKAKRYWIKTEKNRAVMIKARRAKGDPLAGLRLETRRR
jgi:hypothetical protein